MCGFALCNRFDVVIDWSLTGGAPVPLKRTAINHLLQAHARSPSSTHREQTFRLTFRIPCELIIIADLFRPLLETFAILVTVMAYLRVTFGLMDRWQREKSPSARIFISHQFLFRMMAQFACFCTSRKMRNVAEF